MTLIDADDAELKKMDSELQQLFLTNKYILTTSIHALVAAGIRTVEMFHMLGNNESAQTSQMNLGRSHSSVQLCR